jgi:hypothetical protein
MPRFRTNRWWNFILTFCLFAAVSVAIAPGARADVSRDESGVGGVIGDGTAGSGGMPPPNGVGDPDDPQPSSLKKTQRGMTGRTGVLATRAAGDSWVVGNVWMMRLSVMGRVLRIYLVRQ